MNQLGDLIERLDKPEVNGALNVIVSNVVADSRSVRQGDAFVAIKGASFDGHDAVAEAVSSGAIVVIGSRSVSDVKFGNARVGHDVTYIRVEDPRHAFAEMLLQSMPGIKNAIAEISFYAVTGTNGKTTVATLLDQIYTANGKRTGFIGTTGIVYRDPDGQLMTIDATHTTPDVRRLYELIIDMHLAGVETILMEVSSHALEQHRVHGIPFHIAIFTNLTHDHLDYHGSMENYARSKKKLFDSLTKESTAVVSGDDDWTLFLTRDCKGRVIRVGKSALNDVCVVQEHVSTSGCSFGFTAPSIMQRQFLNELDDQTPFMVNIPLIGGFNIMNAALCAVSAMMDGISADRVREMLTQVKSPRGRMESIELPNASVAVIDYAHTPDALEKALSTLREIMDPNQRLHVVFGCGGSRDKSKRPEMGRIACERADEVWITSDNPRTEDPQKIIEDILVGCEQTANKNVHTCIDRREAIENALAAAESLDVILVAGKGHEEYQIIGTEKIPFSDKLIITSLIRQ